MPSPDPIQRAIRLARAGRIREAHILARRALEANPNHAPAWALLAHLVYDPADPSKTIYCLQQLLRLQPDNLKAQEQLAFLTSPVWRHYLGIEDSPPMPEDALSPEPARRGVLRAALVTSIRALGVLAGLVALLVWVAPRIPALQTALGGQAGSHASAASRGSARSTTLLGLDGASDLLALPPLSGIRPAAPATLTPTPTATPAPTPIYPPVDYGPLAAALEDLHREATTLRPYDLGIGFVDVQTGQAISVEGEGRFHAMSTFKGPLAAYYLWLVERGMIAEEPTDRAHLIQMLEVSANTDTSCVFQRVGGIAPFNDWLASQGLSRENNFVLKWQDWSCADGGTLYVPPTDWRYSRGDASLGLPGEAALLACPIAQMPCDKAFAPVELAGLYARLYRGEVISPAYVSMLLGWMEEGPGESLFLYDLPSDSGVRVYVKGGVQRANAEYRENFISEAGIVETPRGAFALAVFMQRNPEWPGTWAISEAARLAYEHFMAAHAEPVAGPGQ